MVESTQKPNWDGLGDQSSESGVRPWGEEPRKDLATSKILDRALQ